nr:histidine kinase dimerization/phospho-acceptor domain-containing protein [Calditrichia bacterium]
MKNLSFRNRIAFRFMVATALLVTLVFAAIYGVVYESVYRHIDGDLQAEGNEVLTNLVILNEGFVFASEGEWKEREHTQIEVNPTFVQVVDPHGRIVRKSGNLFQDELQFDSLQTGGRFFNAKLSRAPVRQVQIAIVNAAGAPVGYIILAAPLKDAELVLNNLLAVLAVLFPIIQVVLFWISRLMAGRSILPVENIITTAERITRENLRERMDLPVHQDELYRLSATINQLLDRLEDSLLREKQFTADASHELRTPLSAVMGTLEVLARKPRSVEHYQTRIGESIRELKRMSDLIDRLLMLARYDSEKLKPQLKPVEMRAL